MTFMCRQGQASDIIEYRDLSLSDQGVWGREHLDNVNTSSLIFTLGDLSQICSEPEIDES
jgi:hypothetical protein